MSEASEIMAPDVQVAIRDGAEQVTVREMNWKAMQAFINLLFNHASLFLKLQSKDGVMSLAINEVAAAGVIINSLGTELVIAATGKDAEWMGTLSATDGWALLDQAVAINLRPEMFAAPKKVMGRLRSILGMATSQTPTTSSSASEIIPASTSTPAPGDSSTS